MGERAMSPANVKDVAQIVLQERPDEFLELLTRELRIPPEQVTRVRPQLEKMHFNLRRALVDRLGEILKDTGLDTVVLSHPGADHKLIAEAKQHLLNELLLQETPMVSPYPMTPELRAWALSLDTEEEILAGLREARTQNGPELGEAVRRIEQELAQGE
jgi:hypothetical protein